MGGQLIQSSEWAKNRIAELQKSLDTLPSKDRPTWNILDELLAKSGESRIVEAALSQPLCTVLQIILVDLLKAAGITFSAVVGHSSGEIGAAYAAGLLSASDAVRIAYYRGFHAYLAGNEARGQKGAMLAVGTSWDDAQELVNLRFFKGRLAIAAHNSSASVTLSGDADAVIHAKKVFDEEKKFARFLKVDTAYHSHHMLPCGDPYVASLDDCDVQVNQDQSDESVSWFSSVEPSKQKVLPNDNLRDSYWRKNMTEAVLFADAVQNAISSDDQISLALEVGPHPALKGPATQIISDLRPEPLPYCGLLNRGGNDLSAFSDALGFVWSHLGAQAVNFHSYENTLLGSRQVPRLAVGLPSYRWNHERIHWTESRVSRALTGRKEPPHELLGIRSTDSNGYDFRWSNVLKLREIPWMEDHKLQGQSVFPAAGYIAMALEASRELAADREVSLFELQDMKLPRAITFEEEDTGVETLVTLTEVQYDANKGATARFSCYSTPAMTSGSQSDLELMASGKVIVRFGKPTETALLSRPLEDYNMSSVERENFYSSLSRLGYGYSGAFQGISSLKRRLNESSVLLDTYPESRYLIHPSTLDVSFQSSMLAYSAPGDERLWSLHVPVAIGSIRINPAQCALIPSSGCKVPACTVVDSEADSFVASIDIFGQDGKFGMVQIDDFQIKPFAPATAADDRRLFTYSSFDFAAPNGVSIAKGLLPADDEVRLAIVCERISSFYIRKWQSEITDKDWANGQPHHQHLKAWLDHTVATANHGEHPTLRKEWIDDTDDAIAALVQQHPDSVDVKLLTAVGEHIPASVRGETTILEHMLPNNLLDDFYKQGVGIQRYNAFLASMVQQITHRYPHSNILEIGKQFSSNNGTVD